MGIKLRGLVLGEMGIDRELLVFPHPSYVLNRYRRMTERFGASARRSAT